jgi:hypothetical protein
MMPDIDGLPIVARHPRALGVRVEGAHKDVHLDSDGRLVPGSGGLSVAPAEPWNIPNHRRPKGMGRGSTGPNEDRVYSIVHGSLAEAELTARPDPARPSKHAFVEPREPVTLTVYEASLGRTREKWTRAWP